MPRCSGVRSIVGQCEEISHEGRRPAGSRPRGRNTAELRERKRQTRERHQQAAGERREGAEGRTTPTSSPVQDRTGQDRAGQLQQAVTLTSISRRWEWKPSSSSSGASRAAAPPSRQAASGVHGAQQAAASSVVKWQGGASKGVCLISKGWEGKGVGEALRDGEGARAFVFLARCANSPVRLSHSHSYRTPPCSTTWPTTGSGMATARRTPSVVGWGMRGGAVLWACVREEGLLAQGARRPFRSSGSGERVIREQREKRQQGARA